MCVRNGVAAHLAPEGMVWPPKATQVPVRKNPHLIHSIQHLDMALRHAISPTEWHNNPASHVGSPKISAMKCHHATQQLAWKLCAWEGTRNAVLLHGR